MKRRIQSLLERLKRDSGNPRGLFRWLWDSLSNNLGWKLLSLLVAILLWNYVVSTNTSITRPKTLFNLTGYVNGQSTLNAYGLALLDNPGDALNGISVTIEAPQTDYSRVSADNVQVTLDLSSIRTAGTQQVPLRATTNYGRVTDIVPESLTLTFESMDSRSIPVNAQLIGDGTEDYWYNISRLNPTLLTVSGAASAVRSIVTAYVYPDVTGLESSTITALPYVLLDASGTEVAQTMLNRSTSSISVSLDVYPTKELPVSTEISNVVTGQPAAGYAVQSVSIQPESITVAADRDLLDSLSELVVEPVSVEGVSQSFSARASVSALSDFKYVSNEQVYVNVTVAEESSSGWVDAVDISFTGVGDGLNVSYSPLRIYITGHKSAVAQAQEEGVAVSVDLSGLGEGSYQITPTFDAQRYPNMILQSEALSVTLTAQ